MSSARYYTMISLAHHNRVRPGGDMQTILCDVCQKPVGGHVLEMHEMWDEAVQTEAGRPRIVARQKSVMLYLCGDWLTKARDHLRQSLAWQSACEHACPQRTAS